MLPIWVTVVPFHARALATSALVIAGLVIAGPTSRVDAAAVPGAPTGLAAVVAGSTVVLSWNPAPGDPDFYIVEAGSVPGLIDLANIPTGSTATTFTAVNVPSGTYFVRVRAATGDGAGPSSNELVVIVGGCTAPQPPAGLTAVVLGTTVRLGWISSVEALSFIVEAGSAPGLANLFNANIGKPPLNEFVATASPGTYYVRVRSVSVCGASVASNEITVVVSLGGTVVIGFNSLAAGTFAGSVESGFTITPTSATWTVSTSFGNPAPFVQFVNQAGPALTGELTVDAAGAPFRLESVDVYSSVTPIPYTLVGLRNAAEMFTVTGTVPNTFGRFATVTNPNNGSLIDTLIIRLVNPQLGCCSNPMGLDNIVLSR